MNNSKERRLSIPLHILKGQNFCNTSASVYQQNSSVRRVSEDVNIPRRTNNSSNQKHQQYAVNQGNLREYSINTNPIDHHQIILNEKRIYAYGFASLLEDVSSKNSQDILRCQLFQSGKNEECCSMPGIAEGNISEHEILPHPQLPPLLFLLRRDNDKLMRFYSLPLSYNDTSVFLNALPDAIQDDISNFIERRENVNRVHYDYLWIEDHYTHTITLLFTGHLQNIMASKNKRVRWRNASKDNVIIYRYSMPYISPKCGMIFINTIKRHRKCCLMVLWFLMIFVISIAIVLAIVFDKSAHPNSTRLNVVNYIKHG
uniref:Uncharacterized protein n=1 Tax=Rhabditophanes sp. KR3021 TaxID=114890 RepID=A0AC35U761_9BILA